MDLPTTLRYCGLFCFFLAVTAEENLEPPAFQPGILYRYRYSLDTQLSYLSRPTLQGSKLQTEALVDVFLLWSNTDNPAEQLLQLQLHDLHVRHDLEKKNEHIKKDQSVKRPPSDTELKQPVYLHWNNGKIEAIYEHEKGAPLILELKRGLLSLLQFQTSAGTVTEEDISGRCQVTYSVSKDTVWKMKDLHSCIRPTFGFSNVNKMFEILWHPTSTSHYALQGRLIKSALSEESHTVYLGMKSTLGVNITSRQYLEFMTQMPSSKEVSRKNLQETLASVLGKPQPVIIISNPSKRICSECPTLRSYLKTFAQRKIKMDLSKASTTWHFSRVVQMLRGGARKRDVLALLRKAPKSMLSFYVEAAVTSQSAASLTALDEFLDLEGKLQPSLLDTFFYAAALSPRPSKELFHLVLDKLNRKNLDPTTWETGNFVIGSLVGKLCQMNQCELKDVKLAKETILQKLKSTKKDSEKVMYLLSLQGALIPDFIPTFLHYAEKGSADVSVTAVAALKRYPTQHISSTVKTVMKHIFHQVQRRHHKMSRLAAAEIILENEPSPMDFVNILLATRELEPEMSRYILSKVQGIIYSPNHPTRQVIKDVLNDPQINNYYFLSSKVGSSISFLGLLAVTEDASSTFGVELLFSEFGLLRKSTTNFNIESHGHKLQAAQVVVEAKGLEGLLGGDTAEGQDFTAGMSTILLDVPLRPVSFFNGYTDLMSKILMSSGEPTNVIKGNLFLVDQQQAIPLQSGLQAVITLQVGLGLDISSDMNMSLWEQEFSTGIQTRGALTAEFQAELDAPFFQATLKSQSDMELGTDVGILARLSDYPVLLCLQFAEKQATFRETFLVSESSANYTTRIRKGRRVTIPGHDFPFYRANSEMCRVLHANKIQ